MRHRIKAFTIIATLLGAVTQPLAAANLPADDCQIFIKRVFAAPNSHGSANVGVVVKVGWIGNGEYVQDVKFYGYSEAKDLGNPPDAYDSSSWVNSNWTATSAVTGGFFAREFGEYEFAFPVLSGSLSSSGHGYQFTSVGAFFVQTNKNTYWLNPELNSDEHFYFDLNAYDSLRAKQGTYNPLATDREDLRYYNPLMCR